MTLETKLDKVTLPPKDSELPFHKLIHELAGKAERYEVIKMKGREPLYNFYNSSGMDVRQFLDPDHMPGITKFTTLVVSEEFAQLRGEEASLDKNNVREAYSDPVFVATMSQIAADQDNYGDSEEARLMRGVYRQAAASALNCVHIAYPIEENDILVGVKRCGSNILDELKVQGKLEGVDRVDIDAKRLRFSGLPDILGAGVSLTDLQIAAFSGRDVRIEEGVVAAGTTEAAIMAEMRNKGVSVASFSCDAAVVCPAGAELAHDLRETLGIKGEDRTSNKGGYLDENWYVRHGSKDGLFARLTRRFGLAARAYVGKQILGDGGDLTSNV